MKLYSVHGMRFSMSLHSCTACSIKAWWEAWQCLLAAECDWCTVNLQMDVWHARVERNVLWLLLWMHTVTQCLGVQKQTQTTQSISFCFKKNWTGTMTTPLTFLVILSNTFGIIMHPDEFAKSDTSSSSLGHTCNSMTISMGRES